MLTLEGCRLRRERLISRFSHVGPLLLNDSLSLRYFANCYIDPFSLGADLGALLLLQPNGHSTLFYDARLGTSVAASHVDEQVPIELYNGDSPAVRSPRLALLHHVVGHAGINGRIHDCITDPLADEVGRAVEDIRRAKDPDEVEQLRQCIRVGEAGQAWGRANVKAGLTELEVYDGVFSACTQAAGRPVIVYGDFAVSPGRERQGGAPTRHVLRDGEMMILDFSVVIQGYRSDFTNTIVVGGRPSSKQQRLYDLCMSALAAGEKTLKPGVPCLHVYNAVRGAFDAAGVAAHFPHHAGHGLGLSHPEAPFFVAKATETLRAGDVVTLEPGLYVNDVGGIRVEHNYLITPDGFLRLTNHQIALS
jgi:Xaa-Pro dipeptidase